jgi:pyruvate,water dikinase
VNTVIMRIPPLEAGRRLAAADALAVPEDVFLLTVDEVKLALRSPSSGDWAEIAAERRAVLEGQRQVNPPMHLGTEPSDELLADAAVNSFSRFFGDPIEQDESSNVLAGTAASRGKVTGRACVVHTLDEADRLQQGDILVCEMTMPAWTPLFGVASAVVTDSGGALSHSAIVAREYGIPCVVGTTSGTRRIADGQHHGGWHERHRHDEPASVPWLTVAAAPSGVML